MEDSRLKTWIVGILGWSIALIIFFPIFWTMLTTFKSEQQALSPSLFFTPTLQSFRDVFARNNYTSFLLNSIYVSLGSTLLCFIIAIPCAYRMAFFPTPKTASVARCSETSISSSESRRLARTGTFLLLP